MKSMPHFESSFPVLALLFKKEHKVIFTRSDVSCKQITFRVAVELRDPYFNIFSFTSHDCRCHINPPTPPHPRSICHRLPALAKDPLDLNGSLLRLLGSVIECSTTIVSFPRILPGNRPVIVVCTSLQWREAIKPWDWRADYSSVCQCGGEHVLIIVGQSDLIGNNRRWQFPCWCFTT